jgi:hypothetical protein
MGKILSKMRVRVKKSNKHKKKYQILIQLLRNMHKDFNLVCPMVQILLNPYMRFGGS